jgi:predicted RNA-binding protein with PIN domain
MSVYLIDGYNLLHQVVGRQEPGGRRSGGQGPKGGSRGGGQSVAGPTGGGPGGELGDGVSGTSVDLDDERRRLLDRIASYMGGTSDRAIVVFDSRAQMLQKSETATAQVEVYFGSFSQSADSIIEREVFALTPGENVIVVSSDYQLQKTVFRPNVIRHSSRQFAAELQEDTKRIANRQNCITMSHRVEERIPQSTLEQLAQLRDELEAEAPCEGGSAGPG